MALLLSSFSQLLIWLIKCYQVIISSLIGANCRFQPTCSNYGIEAILKYSALKGSWLVLKRVLKCHPLNSGGEDPVPLKTFNSREH